MLLALLALPASAHAVVDDADAAITFEPAFVDVDVDAGETVETVVVIKNQTLVDARFDLELTDMRAGPGTDDAFDYVPVGTAPRGAGGWMSIDRTGFELPAGTERQVPITIDVPDDAGAGGHYAALVSVVSATSASGQFDIDYSTPIPILVTVSGDFERDLRVAIAPDATLRWSGGTERWTVELRNEGDVHEVVNGRVRLDSILTGASSAPIRPAILLPGEQRERAVRFDLRSAPDAWHATARIEPDSGEPITATSARTWVVPWWLLVLVVVVVGMTWWRLRVRRVRAREEFEDPDAVAPDWIEGGG